MRPVSVRLDDLKNMVLVLGYVGENEHTRLRIDCKTMYDQYPHAAVSMSVSPPAGAAYPAVIERDGDYVIWDITDSDLVSDGDGEFQLAFTDTPHIAKTYIGKFKVNRSIIPTGTIPSGIDDFITRAGAALTEIPETIADEFEAITAAAETLTPGSSATASFDGENKVLTIGVPAGADGRDGTDGQDGAPGADGFSPSASVTKSGSTATITITDKTGTTTAQISDGESGASVIDDNAGVGDTDKVWSADKTATENGNLLSQIQAFEPPAYDATATYVVGDICWHENKMYCCNTAISTAEQWTSAHWTEIVIPKDVRVNGASVVDANGVANIPKADTNVLGVVAIGGTSQGFSKKDDGTITLYPAQSNSIKLAQDVYNAICPARQHQAVFYGLAKASGNSDQSSSNNSVGVYTEDALSKISEMLNAPVSVSGSTPSITAKSGVQYKCGEVSTLTITVPTSGCIDVVFTSGSTATVLTVTPTKTGVTAIKWANGFDPTSLDANTRYEVLIDDGEWGMVASWT